MKLIGLTTMLGVAAAHDFTVCQGVTDQLGLAALEFAPEPIVAGQPLVVSLKGKTSIDIVGGTASLEVKAMGIKLAHEEFDLCKDAGFACPTTAGSEWKGAFSYPVPAAVPAGIKAEATITVKDASGAAVSCYTTEAEITEGTEMHSKEADEFLFTRFIKQHSKKYEADAFFYKYNTFRDNLKRIVEHNAGNHGWTNIMNHFGDLTADEFHGMYKGYNHRNNEFLRSQNAHVMSGDTPAESVDWREKNAVTPVKNQGQCGSCWAFSTTGSTEGAIAIATGKLVSLSEQELVDCASAEGNMGCNGGLMDNGFEFIIKNGGIETEDDYAYTAKGAKCQKDDSKVAGKISGFKDVPKGDENALKDALNIGPVSVAIEADKLAFQFYHKGVFSGRCGNRLDHGVLAVGYGNDSGKDYWIVKNSWGAGWGDKGFIRIAMGKDLCGIADSASYPTGAKNGAAAEL